MDVMNHRSDGIKLDNAVLRGDEVNDDDDHEYFKLLWQNEVDDNDELDDDIDQNNASIATYICDDDSMNDDPHGQPPLYLSKAILAGLYELPPKHILQYQIGWGRRIRYNHVHHIIPNFQSIHSKNDANNNNNENEYVVEYMTLHRYSQFQGMNPDTSSCDDDTPIPTRPKYMNHSTKLRATQCHAFDIYRIRLKINNSKNFNDELYHLALQEEQTNIYGIQVSNAGGTYHGLPNLFHPVQSNPTIYQYNNDNIRYDFYQYICDCIEMIEAHQSERRYRSKVHTMNQMTVDSTYCDDDLSPSRVLLDLDPKNMEGWVNISKRDGSWNRLHTHEGSAWSGVYYVSSSSSTCVSHGNAYHGNLLLKPTSHPLEDTYTLSQTEQDRLRKVPTCFDDMLQMPYIDDVSYCMIPPIPGDMIIFPSWLHHCVLPVQKYESSVHTVDSISSSSPRISIAFNINWKL